MRGELGPWMSRPLGSTLLVSGRLTRSAAACGGSEYGIVMSIESPVSFVRATFGNGADPVLILNAGGTVLYANAGARDRWPEGKTIEQSDGLGRAVIPA